MLGQLSYVSWTRHNGGGNPDHPTTPAQIYYHNYASAKVTLKHSHIFPRNLTPKGQCCCSVIQNKYNCYANFYQEVIYTAILFYSMYQQSVRLLWRFDLYQPTEALWFVIGLPVRRWWGGLWWCSLLRHRLSMRLWIMHSHSVEMWWDEWLSRNPRGGRASWGRS